MSLEVIAIKDGNGAGKGVVASNLPGGGNVANAFYIIVGGAEAGSANPVPVILDNTLPAPLSTSGGGVEATALRVTIASDSTGVISVDDNGGSITVDGTVALQVAGSTVSDSAPLPVKGGLVMVSGELTRPTESPAVTYAIGDVVGNSLSAATPLEISGCARVNGGTGYIVGAELVTNLKSITPAFRLHIFNAPPTQSNDNLPHRGLYIDVGKRVNRFVLGPMTTPVDTTNSTISMAFDGNLRVPFKCAAGTTSLYFIFETLTAFAPVSEQKFTLILAIDQN